MVILSLKDESAKTIKVRQTAQEKLRRMAKAYMDGLFQDEEYQRQKILIELELESLVIPEINAAKEAGELIVICPAYGSRLILMNKERLYFQC